MRVLALAVLALSAVACESTSLLPGENDAPERGKTEADATGDNGGEDGPAAPGKGKRETAGEAPTPGAGAGGACLPTMDCAAPALPFTARGFRSSSSSFIAQSGQPFHRMRDLFVNPGKQQTVIGKLTYGTVDKDLKGEEVDVFVQRDCASGWEKLGTTVTTEENAHETVDNVVDTGGRIYFPIPKDKELGPGLHRFRLVVAGDGTFADGFLDIVPADTKFFISDVDGTLTSSEEIEFAAFAAGFIPETHEGAPEAFRTLAAKGYRPAYMTSRPELLTQRTREFVAKHGFPPGIVFTTAEIEEALSGDARLVYKKKELTQLKAKGLVPSFGFGNTETDSGAYDGLIPGTDTRFYYQIEDAHAGRRIESYTELVPTFKALANVCTR